MEVVQSNCITYYCSNKFHKNRFLRQINKTGSFLKLTYDKTVTNQGETKITKVLSFKKCCSLADEWIKELPSFSVHSKYIE